MKKLIIILFVLFSTSCFAQFTGGVGDGFACGTSIKRIIFSWYTITQPSGRVNYRCKTMKVAFTINYTPISGNVFTAQISDVNGSFASPTILGTSSTLLITGTISTLPAGDGYKMRIVGSNPYFIGSEIKLSIIL